VRCHFLTVNCAPREGAKGNALRSIVESCVPCDEHAAMEIGKTLRAATRKTWRTWLAKNHASKQEIWLVYPLKHTGKRRLPYNDAVEEALCFGWIDSIVKKLDAEHVAQRFTPRRSAKSDLSETNKERVRRLIRAGLMTPAGLAKIQTRMDEPFVIPADIVRALKKDATTWKNFQAFPEWYQRIRIGFIEATRQQGRLEAFQTRLAYFLKMTARNKRFGMVK
jgi:uncharacterized protein YdeI (YjbR/CyaY-like superfamily)